MDALRSLELVWPRWRQIVSFDRLLLAVACLVTAVTCVQPSPAAEPLWSTSFDAAQEQAAREHKDLLVWITANWSAHDRKLNERVFQDAAFQESARRTFILVKLEYTAAQQEPGQKSIALMKRWGVIAFPTLVLADSQGRAYSKFSGYNAEGPYRYWSYLDWLRQIRLRRDELAAEARRTAGSRRAERLDRALSLLHPALVAADYQDWIADIVSWDGDHAAELKAKYDALRKSSGNLDLEGFGRSAPLTAEHEQQRAQAANLQKEALQFARLGNFTKALASAENAWRLREKNLGRYHRETIESLTFIAGQHLNLHQLDRAEQMYWEGLTISTAMGLERSVSSVSIIGSLGLIYAMQAQYERAAAAMKLVAEVTRDNLELAAATQSDQQQLAALAIWRFRLDQSLSIAARSPEHQASVYEQLLGWKGLMLARQQAMRSQADQPELAPLFADLQRVAAQLAQVTFATPAEAQIGEWRGTLQNLSHEKERLESQIAAKSAEFRKSKSRVLLTDLVAALPEGFALVDCAEYWDRSFEQNYRGGLRTRRRLSAFIVRPGREVQLVDLGNPSTIGAEIDTWRDFGQSAANEAGDRLRKLVWDPLAPHLSGAHTILLSPDGVLARLPLGALPADQPGKYLLEERTFAVVPAPQIVPALVNAAGPKRLPAAANLLVLGGVDYDASARDAALASPAATKKQFGARAVRGEEELRFDSLAATAGELATIAQTYRDNYGDRGITTLKGTSASETTFRQESPRHLYLHLATHGFFSPPKVLSALSGETGFSPGLLSGLALAGANHPEAEGDDGILTAAEVETLDLRRTELAVLSACETGLGEVAGGEGLLGLQRAFQVAGTRSVIASLWKVDDAATRDIMERFYENLWSKMKPDGQPYTKLEALREAQLWMLKERGPRGLKEFPADTAPATKRLPPYYWAAWILSGDWR